MHESAKKLDFPKDFLWGVSTSAYQIEGALHEDGRGPSIWDSFCSEPGRIANGDTAETACDHYHRYPDDVALMATLGVDAYRFSIAWSRIQPNGRGAANPKGLDFYSRLIDALLAKGISPTPTLFHWDLPQALQDAGGWFNRDTADRFAEFARIVAERLGDRVSRWITHNETFEHTVLGHAIGTHAPGQQLGLDIFSVVHHLLLSHGKAVQALRAILPAGAQIGIAQSMARARPASSRIKDRLAAHLLEALHLRMHTDPLLFGRYPLALRLLGIDRSALRAGDLATIAQPLNFLGINFYNPQYVRSAPKGGAVPIEATEPPMHLERTEMGWPVDANGFSELLLYLRKRYRAKLPPIFITENGAAFPDAVDAQGRIDDPRRIAYLQAHLHALRQAMDAGVDVRGYFVWSLLDNFEWAEGYRPRFGLVHVDYSTQQRTPKASFDWYRQVIAANR
ncbi:GH1 family beta-glucosidase [Rhodanobacter sp. MP1X3]|uniref:GH1 family beta-glucosidase n=1 Tax=Rhodanobacter sp. MP1X3 TaxID=2723086 RepID=UPI001620FBD6|nr:GH1 family beta-glucosidase [Rhodanobacter sp. MP1X3]MBB6240856.1 beta-glucosidase [Rhodanobacter sp. MP1X3]